VKQTKRPVILTSNGKLSESIPMPSVRPALSAMLVWTDCHTLIHACLVFLETAPWLEAGLSPKLLHFERPSLLRLAIHGQMMLASRGLAVDLGELQQLTKQCHGDIRFFINTLQLLTTCKEDSEVCALNMCCPRQPDACL
jgi:hypothetical protein